MGPACSPVSLVPVGSQSPNGGTPPTGLWSPDSDLSFPGAWADTSGTSHPPHTPGHFSVSSLSSEIRLLAVILPHSSLLHHG